MGMNTSITTNSQQREDIGMVKAFPAKISTWDPKITSWVPKRKIMQNLDSDAWNDGAGWGWGCGWLP
eukprot:1118548-Amorphochlora_amoeboformis.AAC.1